MEDFYRLHQYLQLDEDKMNKDYFLFVKNFVENSSGENGENGEKKQNMMDEKNQREQCANSPYDLFKLPSEGIDLRQYLTLIEKSLIIQALVRTNGNKNKASKLLGMNRTTLIEKMKKKQLSYL